jgi:hypothetical protein
VRVERYSIKHKDQWNFFVKNSKNGHFFYQREFIEYHSNRFSDFSLLIFDKNDKLISILPANLSDNTLYSHQGLTFGGFITDNEMKVEIMLHIFETILKFCKKENINKIIYKRSPHIYHLRPSEEDLYALFINNFKLTRRDVTTTIYTFDSIEFQERRKRSVKKALKNGLVFEQSYDFKQYWSILEEILKSQYNTKPVHSVDEIMYLADIFPDNIKLFVAKKNEEILAGTLIFENTQIVHTQYLANSIQGRECGALDFVIDMLIKEIYKKKRYFDFGISNENGGRFLNSGLIAQKEGFGARAIAHDFYELQIP